MGRRIHRVVQVARKHPRIRSFQGARKHSYCVMGANRCCCVKQGGKMKQSHTDHLKGENAFGRSCATLRKRMHLTQRELGRLLGISEQAIGQWERGVRSPTVEHLKRLLALGIQRRAFAPSQEQEEAQQLWLAAGKPADFDAFWMQVQLAAPSARSSLVVLKRGAPQSEVPRAEHSPPLTSSHFDWGDALDVHDFYGREAERLQLEQWVLQECCQTQPCLLVLDNLETLLQAHDPEGHFRPGYQDYAALLRRVAQTAHQSCLLFTSRESPAELVHQESRQNSMRSLRLAGLELEACEQLFEERDLVSSRQGQLLLAQLYAGNPLALKIVAETITELFGGEIAPFLEQGEVIFSTIRDLLAEQFARLSATEQALLFWLAIVREPLGVDELQERLIVTPVLVRLEAIYWGKEAVEEQLLGLLSQLRALEQEEQSYGPANLISLLRALRGHLRRLDLSHLSIRGVYLQGVEMQDATLSEATLRDA